jgi:hypothetical protein
LFDNNLYMISLSWILTTLGIIHLLLLIFIPKIANKNKKQIQNFRQEDFKSLLHDLESHKPDEAYIARFKVRSARYLSNLDQHFKIIILSIENYDQKSYEQTLLNILVFNDNYTTKWTSRANYFQLKMFYEMCAVFQKKQK